MSRKIFIQSLLIVVILLVSFAGAGRVLAWSGCGGSYVVQWGDTMGGIAAKCGVTVSALYAANPWTNGYLYAGQVLVIPTGGYNPPPYNGGYYTGTYTVQWGDSFSKIAQRYGVSVNSLWAANPNIWNINYIYPGQVLNVPATSNTSGSSDSSWFHIVSTDYDPLVERAYGAVAPGTPTGKVKLINIANADVYVSLQGTTNDGAKVIHEYPVDGSMSVTVPAGWYLYVAWVGGEKLSGQFKLSSSSNRTMTFYPNRIVVE